MMRLFHGCNERDSLEVCLSCIALTGLVRLRNVSARWWHGRVSLPVEKEMGMSVKKISLLHPATVTNTFFKSCNKPSQVSSLVNTQFSVAGCFGLLCKVISPVCPLPGFYTADCKCPGTSITTCKGFIWCTFLSFSNLFLRDILSKIWNFHV